MSKNDDTLRGHAHYSGAPWTPDNEYFAHAETVIEAIWNDVIWPVIGRCEFQTVIDLAAGHGRNSTRLRSLAKHILILDVQPGNVEVCRNRFRGDPIFKFAVNNGYDLRPAEDASYTLVYCFDAMVHFHRDTVDSYLIDSRRALVPGGHAFFHHSNYTGGDDGRTGPSSRAYMSAELFANLAQSAGLEVVDQRVMEWNGYPGLDCLTLLRKPF